MKNPPAVEAGGTGQARTTQRLPYISRRSVRAADIGTSLPPITPIVNVLHDEEVAELPRIGVVEPVGVVGEGWEQIVAGAQRVPVRCR